MWGIFTIVESFPMNEIIFLLLRSSKPNDLCTFCFTLCWKLWFDVWVGVGTTPLYRFLWWDHFLSKERAKYLVLWPPLVEWNQNGARCSEILVLDGCLCLHLLHCGAVVGWWWWVWWQWCYAVIFFLELLLGIYNNSVHHS